VTENKRKKIGRPLQGTEKRVRASYTLPPRQLLWLREKAAEYGVSQSAVLEKVIAASRSDSKIAHAHVRVSIPHERIASFGLRHRITSLRLFGSVVRSDFGPESDIDVLVEFRTGEMPTYFTLVGMEHELSEIFAGRTVDLRTPNELSPYFCDRVFTEAETIYSYNEDQD
jgi:uncharacterized protein